MTACGVRIVDCGWSVGVQSSLLELGFIFFSCEPYYTGLLSLAQLVFPDQFSVLLAGYAQVLSWGFMKLKVHFLKACDSIIPSLSSGVANPVLLPPRGMLLAQQTQWISI